MTKYLNIHNENYKIKVQSGGRITLDTGVDVGEVVITGNLRIEGTTTTVESQNTVIKDNIIRLNDGETGNGVSLDESGLVIDRGNFVDVEWVFDGDAFVLVQARPVTAMKQVRVPEMGDQPDFWSNGNFRDAVPMVPSRCVAEFCDQHINEILHHN